MPIWKWMIQRDAILFWILGKHVTQDDLPNFIFGFNALFEDTTQINNSEVPGDDDTITQINDIVDSLVVLSN